MHTKCNFCIYTIYFYIIDKFIQEPLLHIRQGENLEQLFTKFWETEKALATSTLIAKEQSNSEQFKKLIKTDYMPREDKGANTLAFVPKILERKAIVTRLK